MIARPQQALEREGSAPGRYGFADLVRLAPVELGCAIALAMLSAVASIAPFWLIYRMTDTLLLARPSSAAVWRIAVPILALLALRWALMAASHTLAPKGAFLVQHRLRLAIARHLGEVPLSFFAGHGSGSLRHTLHDDVNSLEGFLAHMLPDAVTSATVPLAALALLFGADWRLALIALLPLPAALAAQVWMMRRADARMQEWNALQRRMADQVAEYVRGIHVVRSFGLDARSFGELAAVIRGASAWVAGYARHSATAWMLFTCLLSSNLALVAPLGAWFYRRGTLDLATYVLFLLVAPAVLQPLLRLTFTLGEQVQRAQALERINSLLRSPSLRPASTPRISDAPLDLEFTDVVHRYGGRLAVDGATFRARPGTITVLVGPSGSGKSTLVRLLPRLYDCESGTVRIGGVDVRDWPLDALLARISIVFQEVFLFHGTVSDNLRLARPDADRAAIAAAAEAARAHDFIQALPQGYNTVLGERGMRLSGGQRQRLSIARALLKDAPILLLDEATASLDPENAALIQQALDRLCRGRTVLMIAHHLRTVVQADHIVVMDRGRVAGQGRHDFLLRNCPVYRRLWEDHEQARDWSLGHSDEATR